MPATATAAWLVASDASLRLTAGSNYALLGRQAFQMLGALTNHVEAFRMRYSELDSAEDTLSTLLARVIEK